MLRKSKKPKHRRTKPIFRFEAPQWFKSLPATGGHGSNAHQKRLWKLVSEYVLERDFKKYGYCVSCKHRFNSWREGQAGHFRAWSLCNGMFKYNERNMALICQVCNFNEDSLVGARFGDEMKRRHGENFIEWVASENAKYRGTKMDLPDLVSYAEEIIKKKEAL